MMREITWYCGKTWEPWSPRSLETGIAGSQAAVIHLSREWAKLGHKVRVYNFCAGQEGNYDGVEYIPFEKFDKDKGFDILIVWRERNLPLLDKPLKARKIILALHDFPYHKGLFTKERTAKISKITVVSKYHLRHFINQPWAPHLKKRIFRVITNGADERFLARQAQKAPFRLIYNSDYNRGLEQMLKYGWPVIKKIVPQAMLHVYYGWNFLDNQNGDEKYLRWKEEMIAIMKEGDIIDHGRAPIEELIKAKQEAVIHYYGCIWHENDCISVRESAMAGCVPVTTNYSALAEKPYCLKVWGNPEDRRTQERLARNIVALLNDQSKLAKISDKFRKLASRETWDLIACKWLMYFG